MTYLWWPDPKRMDELGYGSIAFVPVLFDANWNYHTELNRYLRERALLEWQPKDVDSSSDRVRHVSQNQYPTKKTLENIARQLCNFFDWIAWKNLEWKSIEYTKHLVRGYQLHMLKGSWSARKKPLSAGTINIRVRAACAFMAWAAERGFREDFKVKSAKRLVRADSGTHAHGHKALETNARAGRVRSNPASLRIPTEAEIALWLSQVEIYHGRTKALCSRLIVETAIRIQETVQWRTDTLPLDKADWKIVGDSVEVEVRFGAKGSKPTPDSLEGPPRWISLPLSLAEALDEYRRVYRPILLGKWIRSGGSPAEINARRHAPKPKQLFLSDSTGMSFSAQALYSSWKGVPSLPFAEWSPHLGRHYWACRTLLKSQITRAELMGRTLEGMPTDWVTAQAATDIQLLIQPQMGHLSAKTTLRYLQWIQRAISLSYWTDHYHKELERVA